MQTRRDILRAVEDRG